LDISLSYVNVYNLGYIKFFKGTYAQASMRRVNLVPSEQRRLIANCMARKGNLKILSRDLGVSYSSMKKYYQEVLLLPESLFKKLLGISGFSERDFNFTYLDAKWGSSVGGEKGMAVLREKYGDKILGWRRRGGLNRWKGIKNKDN